MFGLIEGWLFSQLGISCSLNKLEDNNIFRDGCVLVKVLQKYGLVSSSFSENILPSGKKEECSKNLKLLKPLFDMLKIKYNEAIINDIVENKTGPIINLLYELYICLENKQHLYFITKQNFDKVCQDTLKNLSSISVSENIPKPESDLQSGMCLEQPLLNNADVINWYKNNYKKVKSALEVKLYHSSVVDKELMSPACPKCVSRHKSLKNEQFEELPDLNLFLKSSGNEKLLDYESFIARYKAKQNSKAVKKCFQGAIQHELLQRTWNKIEEKEEKVYDSVFSGVLLKQSNYEKQILSKLIQAQQETQVQNENKIWAKQSIIKESENKMNNDFQLKEKFETLENIYKKEQQRVLELHKKLYLEKKDIIRKEIYNICKESVDALLDIVTCAAEYKAQNGVEVSECLWNNWMQLFIKSQPIHVQLESLEDLGEDDIDFDEALSLEKEQDEVLNENDIEEYLMTIGKWYYSNVCLEHADLNERYLAFIVYRLLFLKYPLPPSPPAADLPPYKMAGVLLNFYNADSIEKLKLLLSKSGIHVFDTETAIKKCIKQFQSETAPPPEEKLKNKKKDSGSKQKGGKEKKNSKKKDSKKSEKKKQKNSKTEPTINIEGENIINVVEKETQTSLVIETGEEKTNRTPLGLLGEEVSNVMKEGSKLNDSLLVSIIIEYLKSLDECDGWLLLNYPETIDQAFHLELALTGKKIPLEGFVSEENQTLQVQELDEWSEKRKSKLLNYPLNETGSDSSNSYFTVFVKIQDEDHKIPSPDNKINEEVNNQESNSVDSDEFKEEVGGVRDCLKEFYTNQAIFKEVPSPSSDINSLKMLARVILKEDGVDATLSVDLFGEETLNKLTKAKKIDKKAKPSLKNKKEKPKGGLKTKGKPEEILNKSSITNQETDVVVEIANQEPVLENNDSSENQNEPPTGESEQNDKKVNFVSLPLNNEFGMLLATVWENIESCYITNLKETLFENRFINLRLYPYCIYVEKEVKKVIDKPDLKQNLINFFQDYYNKVSNELRSLPEMKNQLHCRVLELQQNLWEIADQRKIEIEAKRQEIISENWFVNEICLLINNYLSFLQTEFERSLETLKLVNDYYMSLLEKIPPVNLAIQPESRNVGRISSEMLLNMFLKESSTEEQIEDNLSREIKANNTIARYLINCSDEETPINAFETIFSEKVNELKSKFNSISLVFHNQNKTEANFISNANKEKAKGNPSVKKEKSSIKSKKETKQKKSSSKSGESPPQLEAVAEISIKETLIEEWQTTINTETERFLFRLDLIHERAKENIFEFYCYLESVFCNLHKSIFSSYNNEISNINSICNFLKTAIEEESPIEHPLILGQNNFFVGVKDTESRSTIGVLKELEEDLHDCIFTVKQLYYLMDFFKVSGPLGVIRKQPLCYILQDLLLLDTSDNHPYLPKMWGLLDDSQLRNVIDEIFGLEFGVDWRDFIIYNLDIPYPEVKDILHLRKQFVSLDLEETELISEKDYENITLWFENELPSGPKQGLRFALVKKLLAELFKVDREQINYTALLLYFCKDFDPVNGLKKALSLSLGKNVVVSKSELEIILQEEEETNQIVCCVLKEIIDGIALTKETAQVYEILESLSKMKLSNDDINECSWQSSQFGSYRSGSFKSLEPDFIKSEFNSNPLIPPPPSDYKYSICFSNPPGNEKSWITKIPVSSVLSVLNSSFFYQDRRFALKTQYLGCLEDEADADGMIEAYDLVNLSCIQKLFTLTNKFKISKPCDILRDCLKDDRKSEVDSSSKRFTIDF